MLSDYRFAQTIYNLRVADANCFAKARSWRRTHTPTYHAKKRSIRLGLSVDTGKAARLSISAISTKPYPQIVQTYSPILESKGHVMTTTYVAGPTANDLLSVNATLTEYLARTAQLTPDNTCDRLLYPPTGYEDQPAAWRSEPDVPSSVVTYPAAVLSTQSTSSSASSSTLTTPEDRIEAPLKIRISFKRKSCDMEDGVPYVEKRPKYGRKNWVNAFRHDGIQLRDN